MSLPKIRPWKLGMLCLLVVGVGCQVFSDQMTRWKMLDDGALENPIGALGGDAVVFSPKDDHALTREQLEDAKPEELIAYYAPIFIQQHIDSSGQPYPYPKEYDDIGEPSLKKDEKGNYLGIVSGQPKMYWLFQRREIDASDHIQLTYTAWYPAHPRMKTLDLESANVDSIVVRITLDSVNVPLFYETITASGFYHKIFIPRWVENAARVQFGPPEPGKSYSIERQASGKIDWEVAGVVEEIHEQPRRPVFFIRSGDHRIIGMGNQARLKLPPNAQVRQYELKEYHELFAVRVEGSTEKHPFFDQQDGHKVYGAERGQRYVFTVLGMDSAGQPRSNDQIKAHFDQSDWEDMTAYSRYLKVPPVVLRTPLSVKPAASQGAFMGNQPQRPKGTDPASGGR
jgi:hypothetical protein